MAEEKKKKKHTGRNVTIGVAAALLLSLGGWLGFGNGGGFGIPGFTPGGSEANSGTGTQTVEPAPQTVAPEPDKEDQQMADDSIMSIVVAENTVTVNGTEVEAAGLEDFLRENYSDGVSVSLKDNGAIKATYDEVAAVLAKLDITFSTE